MQKKADLKNAIVINTSKLAKKVDLATFKCNLVNLDFDKSKNVSAK